jgi:hypothetical protein
LTGEADLVLVGDTHAEEVSHVVQLCTCTKPPTDRTTSIFKSVLNNEW